MAAEKKNGKGQRDARGRFASGNSGKPKGARHRTTLAVEKLLGADANKLTRKVIELALSGDSTALKLAIDRVAPVRRGRPVIIDNFPKVTSAADVPGALSTLLEAVAKGEMTTDEADAIASLCSRYVGALEAVEFDARLKAIEERLK